MNDGKINEFLACVGNHPIIFVGCHLEILPGGFLWMCFSPRRQVRKIRALRQDLHWWCEVPVSAWRDVTWLWNHRHDYKLPYKQKINFEKNLPCVFFVPHLFTFFATLNQPPFYTRTVLYQGIRIAAHIHNPRPSNAWDFPPSNVFLEVQLSTIKCFGWYSRSFLG